MSSVLIAPWGSPLRAVEPPIPATMMPKAIIRLRFVPGMMLGSGKRRRILMNIFAGTIPSASSSSVNSFVQRDQAACHGTATIVVAIGGVVYP